MIVYPPEGHHTPSEDIIIDTVSNLQKDKPEAAIIVLGDFNQEQFNFNTDVDKGKWSEFCIS